MSLSSILNVGASGLLVAQTQLRTVSDNIANINTPGYARRIVDQQSLALAEMGGGVEVAGIRRVVDQFLQQATLSAASDAGSAAALSEMLDRAQSLFGDPSADTSYFNQLDESLQAFSAAGLDPSSRISRDKALASLSDFLSQSAGVAGNLRSLRAEADGQIATKIDQVNRLLTQIDDLNTSITRAKVSGQDASGAQNAQAQLIDQLSGLMDITLQAGPDGRTIVRGPKGALLVSQNGPATLSYETDGSAPGRITAQLAGASAIDMTPGGGELKGLLDLRNTELPNIGSELGEYVSRAVDELNRAHNASSSVPAPAKLSGRDTGLDLPTAIGGFTGKTTMAITDPAGVIQRRVEIDFDAGTMSVDGGAATSFNAGNFLNRLNSSLGSAGSASFANGALSLQASGAGNGVAIADDATAPSMKAGRGFSHFFGLNDLITSTGFPDPATGLRASDPHGFSGDITLRISDPAGGMLRDVKVSVPPGGTMADLVAALNDTGSGVGLYGAYALDTDGRLAFTPNATGGQVAVIGDTTARGAGGPSMTQLVGLDPQLAAARASGFSIRSDIAAQSSKLAFAQLDLSAAAGTPALAVGDGSGALALGSAGELAARFAAAGGLGAGQMTLAQYAAQLSGSIGQRSASASSRADSAAAVAGEAISRRSSVEGVNLDEELVQLTTYQQAYNASARLIQAVKDMYDVLLGIA
jgi:flagellar hook-associated protein 1 FlgK